MHWLILWRTWPSRRSTSARAATLLIQLEPCSSPSPSLATLHPPGRQTRASGSSALAWPDGVPVIHLRRDLTPTQINHAVAHELGEWLLHMWGFHGPPAEDLSGRIGAALCVPRPAFHLAHSELGENVPALAQVFTVSESLMALRIAECLGHPTALITPRRVRTRGGEWCWPTSEHGWRSLVKRPDAFGVCRHPIRDARSRIVLRPNAPPR